MAENKLQFNFKIPNAIKKRIGGFILLVTVFVHLIWLSIIWVWPDKAYNWQYVFWAVFVTFLWAEALYGRDPKKYGIPKKRRFTFMGLGIFLVLAIWTVDYFLFDYPEILARLLGYE